MNPGILKVSFRDDKHDVQTEVAIREDTRLDDILEDFATFLVLAGLAAEDGTEN